MAEWTTSAAYVLAAWLGWQALGRVRRRSHGTAKSRTRFWMAAAPVLMLLCVSKFLDLSSVVSSMGKQMAMTEGWYVHRRVFQVFAILGVASGGVGVVGYLAWRQREIPERYLGALFGLAYLLGFVVVRAISLHQIDAFLAIHVGAFSVNWLLENAGIACMALAAYYTARRSAAPRESVPTRPHQEVAMIRARRAHVAQVDRGAPTPEELAQRQARRAAYREGLAGGMPRADVAIVQLRESTGQAHAANETK